MEQKHLSKEMGNRSSSQVDPWDTVQYNDIYAA